MIEIGKMDAKRKVAVLQILIFLKKDFVTANQDGTTAMGIGKEMDVNPRTNTAEDLVLMFALTAGIARIHVNQFAKTLAGIVITMAETIKPAKVFASRNAGLVQQNVIIIAKYAGDATL